jgi:hypothetical protein
MSGPWRRPSNPDTCIGAPSSKSNRRSGCGSTDYFPNRPLGFQETDWMEGIDFGDPLLEMIEPDRGIPLLSTPPEVDVLRILEAMQSTMRQREPEPPILLSHPQCVIVLGNNRGVDILMELIRDEGFEVVLLDIDLTWI